MDSFEVEYHWNGAVWFARPKDCNINKWLGFGSTKPTAKEDMLDSMRNSIHPFFVNGKELKVV